MLWKGERESGNIEDRRSFGGARTTGALGIGGLIIGAVVYYFMGGNPLVYLAQNAPEVVGSTSGTTQSADDSPNPSAKRSSARDQMSEKQEADPQRDQKAFVSVVLAETEDVWKAEFQRMRRAYSPPTLVLYRGVVNSECGRATKASGPFYCPSDRKVYLDLSFLDELSNRFGAKGDFAGAYVIAHEVGHHVQNSLGLERVSHLDSNSQTSENQISVAIELQADCLAGVWAKRTESTTSVIEPGDIKEAMNAASAVGDDRLQKRAQGYIIPDSFTHGSSQQRTAAFQKGYEGGQIGSCVSGL